jgi:RHS repeat-associated protein
LPVGIHLIHNVAAAGTADESGGVFTIEGSGADNSGTADEFHYVYQPLSGDGEIVTQVISQTVANFWSKAGLMMRESLADDSPHVTVAALTQANRIQNLDRATTGGSTNTVSSAGMTLPVWLKLVRSGNDFTSYRSADGANWTQVHNVTISMNTDIYVGMAVTARLDGQISTAVFTDVSVNGGGGPTPTPTSPPPTNTPGPTATATLTPTMTPTNTPAPTNTPTPTPPPATETVIQRTTYTIAGQAVALRLRILEDSVETSNDLYYLHSDHLGSAGAMSDATGGYVPDSLTRYEPFGGYRGDPPATNPDLTDMGFTGHKHNDSVGLIYMNARFYVQGIGRFASADTIVPNPNNPQSFNRYSYTRNNPINLVDPTGHRECGEWDDCSDPLPFTPPPPRPPILPSTPPDGLSDRPYGSEIIIIGPGGKQAWEAFNTLQENEGWWGNELDAEEAMILVLNAEFGPLIYQNEDGTWYVPPEVIEAATRKYNQFCSGGPWSANCFNGFWAYMQSITDVLINQNQIDNLANHPNYYDPERMTYYRSQARSVMNNPELGGQVLDRPSDWANASISLAVYLEEYPQLRYSFYPGNSNFTVYTRNQYNNLQNYNSCLSSGENSQTCLNIWTGN